MYREPDVTWRWKAKFPDLDPRVAAWCIDFEPQLTFPTEPFVIQTLTVPEYTIGTKPVFEGAVNRDYAGFITSEGFSGSFADTNDLAVSRYFRTWMAHVVNVQNMTFMHPTFYEKEVYILKYNIINDKKPIARGILHEVWPTGISSPTFQYGESNFSPVDVNFSCLGTQWMRS